MRISQSRARFLYLLLVALTIIFLIAVQSHHFHSRPYREDEAWVIHYALANIEAVGLPAHVADIIARPVTPESFLQDIWVYLFGHKENIVRFFATLVTSLTLATVYRLGTDLYDRRTGWLSVGLLGSYAIFAYYTHEARPLRRAGFRLGRLPLRIASLHSQANAEDGNTCRARRHAARISASLHGLRA